MADTPMTKEIVAEIDSRFTSLNPIPVERATIRRHEWDVLKGDVERLRAALEHVANSGCPYETCVALAQSALRPADEQSKDHG